MVHDLHNRGIPDKYRAAGCVLTDKLYVAFSNAAEADNDKIQAMIDHWDKQMKELKKTDKIAETMQKYGLIDWNKTAERALATR